MSNVGNTVYFSVLQQLVKFDEKAQNVSNVNDKKNHSSYYKLTKIDAKMGVLIIHQNTSVFSIISQHLVRHKTTLLAAQCENSTKNKDFFCSVFFLLPYIIIVGFSNAPSCDENCRTP